MINEKGIFKEDYKYFLTRVKKARTILKELINYAGLDRNKKINVLAVGGEFGFIEYNLSKWTNWVITTSDVDAKSIKKYPILRRYVNFKVLDATKLPFKQNTFDLVIFNHVVEHIMEYKKAINELHRVLGKTGILYLATPNIYRKLVPLRILFSKKKGVSDSKRIRMHMGFSKEELQSYLSIFRTSRNISKDHLASNLGFFRHISGIFPKKLFERYAQTHVFICRK